MIVNVKQGAV